MTDHPDTQGLHEFEQRKSASFDGITSSIDEQMMQLVRSWHRHPCIAPALWYRGVNMGEMLEWALIPHVMESLLDTSLKEKGGNPE